MDAPSIVDALTSLKAVTELIKGWRQGEHDVTISLDQVSELRSAVLDAQEHAMTARQAQYDLLQRNNELEKELQALKGWNVERENYRLVNVPKYGAVVYAPNPNSNLEEAPHWLCQPCFENKTKSMLQFFTNFPDPIGGSDLSIWQCPVCKGEIRVQPNARPS